MGMGYQQFAELIAPHNHKMYMVGWGCKDYNTFAIMWR
jgi:hypothetical protein